MGKKNKNDLKNDNIDKNNSDSGIQKKTKKKKLNKDKSEKAAMSKKIIFDNEAQTSNDKDSPQMEINTSITTKEVSKTKPKNNKNKKIIFGDDDEPRDVSPNRNDRNSNKNINLNYEEEPKDEDIDKFCDEIDEEDNEQYENWIKLVEAKLSSNKRKV
ncbi:ribonuclease 3-like [Nymphalis io]|uniref:ribonuclease 3-like n=1 Tax=Inachis io TaxID=171585 RepID=UPI0021695AF2|nr:ribonuclease 3-like [Nymphalis io]XP_050348159.1 ribonuclease 3-like [Nymphalis io]XP_050348160.1 ribonuclease 3-like [Nymphalis io]